MEKGRSRTVKKSFDLAALMQSKAMSNPKNKGLSDSLIGMTGQVVSDLDEKIEKENARKKQERYNKRMAERKQEDMLFLKQIEAYGIYCQPEYKFHKTRGWRIDFFIEYNGVKLAVEVEGGVFTGGRHTTSTGFIGDMEKYNEFVLYGIWLYRVIPSELNKETTIANILKIIKYDGKRDNGTLFG
jgi:hypothetical protein